MKIEPGQWWESPDGDKFLVIAPLITKGWWALDDGTEEPDSLHETSFRSWTYLGTSSDPDPHVALLEAEHDDRQDPEECPMCGGPDPCKDCYEYVCDAVGMPPQQPTRKRVRLWIPREHNSRSATFATIDSEMNRALWRELHHDGDGFYVEEQT